MANLGPGSYSLPDPFNGKQDKKRNSMLLHFLPTKMKPQHKAFKSFSSERNQPPRRFDDLYRGLEKQSLMPGPG